MRELKKHSSATASGKDGYLATVQYFQKLRKWIPNGVNNSNQNIHEAQVHISKVVKYFVDE